jgi:hypothetical protein
MLLLLPGVRDPPDSVLFSLPVPCLQAPTADELASVPLPSLPELLDLSHEPAAVCFQSRTTQSSTPPAPCLQAPTADELACAYPSAASWLQLF